MVSDAIARKIVTGARDTSALSPAGTGENDNVKITEDAHGREKSSAKPTVEDRSSAKPKNAVGESFGSSEGHPSGASEGAVVY